MRNSILACFLASSLGCSSAEFALGADPETGVEVAAESDTRPAEGDTSGDDAEFDSGALADSTTDTSAVDSGTASLDSATIVDTGMAMVDTASVDTGTPMVDTGTATIDTGTAMVDTGTMTIDTGTVMVDTGTVVVDTAPACTVASCPAPKNPCYQSACIDGACGIAPKPKGAFCNGFLDQCDGLGNCIDCTDNGGCGECCICSANKCIPA